MISEIVFMDLMVYILAIFNYGNMAATPLLVGSPLFSADKLFTSWWTAAFANPYPIIPGRKYRYLNK